MFRISVQDMHFEVPAWFVRLRDLLRGNDRYHPEKHYMRGPGPKTRAKRAAAADPTRNQASRNRA
jgi:hypothetical protein